MGAPCPLVLLLPALPSPLATFPSRLATVATVGAAAATLRALVGGGDGGATQQQQQQQQRVPREKLIAVWPWFGYAYSCNESGPLLAPCRSALPFCCGPGTAAAQLSFAAAEHARSAGSATRP